MLFIYIRALNYHRVNRIFFILDEEIGNRFLDFPVGGGNPKRHKKYTVHKTEDVRSIEEEEEKGTDVTRSLPETPRDSFVLPFLEAAAIEHHNVVIACLFCLTRNGQVL
ncbi:hypothetical protein SKAU_G00274780 [Synaphobranchus kaupii]|uniref:Uncharacterized protein n=1 Tax=Synaphobranchus kaupii TaxID=118154 RepID=A0A9Q1F1C1_SYNKA|nr:hypothetical protein SKAU_G00274780 [Synaphobranchus kaupii]